MSSDIAEFTHQRARKKEPKCKDRRLKRYPPIDETISEPGEEWRSMGHDRYAPVIQISNHGRLKRLFHRPARPYWTIAVWQACNSGYGEKFNVTYLGKESSFSRCQAIAMTWLEPPEGIDIKIKMPRCERIDQSQPYHASNVRWVIPKLASLRPQPTRPVKVKYSKDGVDFVHPDPNNCPACKTEDTWYKLNSGVMFCTSCGSKSSDNARGYKTRFEQFC